VSSLVACGKLDEYKAAVLHLANTSFTLDEDRSRFFAKLKDILMKQSQLIGIPLVITAVSHIAKVQKELGMAVPSVEEQQKSSHYANMQATANLDVRGEAHMRLLYRSNLDPIMATWGAHEVDFTWLEKRIIYGMFLSDHNILNIIETEVLLVASIMCQGLNAATMWHIRGLRRLDVSVEDAEKVCDIIKMVAKFSGKDTSGWLMAKDVDTSG
jgi:hypothetical protein